MKLIIFDCDGTLVESEWLGNLGLELELRTLGIVETADGLTARYRGAKLANLLADLSRIHDCVLPDDFVQRYRARVQELFTTHLRPVLGIEEVLARVQVPICVASSGPLEKIRHALSVTGLLPYFAGHIFSSYEIQAWKPNPEIFLHAARQMRILPADCLVVEDSDLGIEAAHRAGMRSVLYDPGSIYPSSDAGLVIHHMVELRDWLDNQPAR